MAALITNDARVSVNCIDTHTHTHTQDINRSIYIHSQKQTNIRKFNLSVGLTNIERFYIAGLVLAFAEDKLL